MAFRYMEDFDRDKMLKYAKGELALQNKPVTEENIEKKLDDLYYEWLLSKVVDIFDKNGEIYNLSFLFDILKSISIEYCIIIEQWVENKPINYKGAYFTFEEIYNDVKKNNDELGQLYEFHMLIQCICCFKECEKNIETYEQLTKKDIDEFKEILSYQMSRNFFFD